MFRVSQSPAAAVPFGPLPGTVAPRPAPPAPLVRLWHLGPQEPAMRPQTDRQRLIRKALTILIPQAPYGDFAAIYERARTKKLRELRAEDAAFLALAAHVRHEWTDYDELLAEGYDAESARHFVLDDMNDVLTGWGATKLVDGSEDTDQPAS